MLKRLTILVLGLIIVAVVGAAWAYRSYQDFTAAPLPHAQSVMLTVIPGQGYRAIVDQLAREGVVKHRWHWWVLGRRSELAGRIQAGEFAVPVGLTAPQVLKYLADGRVVQHALTIVDGWTFKELVEAVSQHPALDHTLQELEREVIAQRIDADLTHPEGWFEPETYYFPRGTTDLSVFQRAYAAQKRRLADVWSGRDVDLPLKDPKELLILASIVEKETGLATERAEIAGVFVRRLRKGMRLQTDPTVIYGLGDDFDGDIRRRDLRADTPYNTYTRHGLPPTPIAMPGKAALEAVAHPGDGDALYFVARGDGSHQFSRTLDEHNLAVRKYQLKKSKK
ncbi:MAG: endolytic transglycosylase MltG [Lysobacterales bacterium]